jgi:uncharacterized integral membrane protein
MANQRPDDVERSEGRKLGLGAIGSGTGIAALLLFMVQNTQDARVEFLVWEFVWSVWLIVLVSAALGAVVWVGLGILRRRARRAKRRQDR